MSSNADTLATVYLAGEAIGVSPVIWVEPLQLSFPWISAGDTATETITISNYSVAALHITSIDGGNDAFFTNSDIPFSISPNSSENIEILFNPDTAMTPGSLCRRRASD